MSDQSDTPLQRAKDYARLAYHIRGVHYPPMYPSGPSLPADPKAPFRRWDDPKAPLRAWAEYADSVEAQMDRHHP